MSSRFLLAVLLAGCQPPAAIPEATPEATPGARELPQQAPRDALPSPDGLLGTPSQSADGNRVAWARIDGAPPDSVIERSDAGGPPKVIARGIVDRVSISPDGTAVVFVRGGAIPQLVLIADGQPERALTNAGLTREPGKPPVGFVPVPDAKPVSFDGDQVTWTAAGTPYSVDWR